MGKNNQEDLSLEEILASIKQVVRDDSPGLSQGNSTSDLASKKLADCDESRPAAREVNDFAGASSDKNADEQQIYADHSIKSATENNQDDNIEVLELTDVIEKGSVIKAQDSDTTQKNKSHPPKVNSGFAAGQLTQPGALPSLKKATSVPPMPQSKLQSDIGKLVNIEKNRKTNNASNAPDGDTSLDIAEEVFMKLKGFLQAAKEEAPGLEGLRRSTSVEDIALASMEPYIHKWLDNNLQKLVDKRLKKWMDKHLISTIEQAVAKEIALLARKYEGGR